jgi:uncharacterized protein YcaQ
MQITNKQARQFILRRHGLLGQHQFSGQEGIMTFFSRVNAIQYDPVNICGKNADIVLHSRIRNYQKSDLTALLYQHRKLIDFCDKCQCIFAVTDFPIFLKEGFDNGSADAFTQRGGEAVKRIEPLIRQLIKERGHISAREVDIKESIDWFWGAPTSLPRAALESMYMRGELIIHHKKGTVKSYALTEDHIPKEIMDAPPPYNTDEERNAWHIRRRVSAVGMLWNKAGDAWIGLGLKAAARNAAFAKLLEAGEILEINAEGINEPLYICANEQNILEAILQGEEHVPPRTEFIAPLDSLMWDRKLIDALFNFQYKWEIYTPQIKRKYGPYTLPILHGDALVGRIDAARKDNQLVVNNIWMQNGKPPKGRFKNNLDDCLQRFSIFNNIKK